jgi:hypothetical protein
VPSIVPPEGTSVAFDRERLERSLVRRGLDPLLAAEVAGRVARLVAEHPGEAIPLDHLHPLIGEALLDVGRDATLSARAPTSEFRVTPPAHAPSPLERRAAVPATPAAQAHGLDPWWALRRLGLSTPPDGLAFVGPGALRTVYANDTPGARTISLRVAYSGKAVLQLPGGRRAKLEGLGREVRDVEVPSGAVVCVEGELAPYSAVAWWIA